MSNQTQKTTPDDMVGVVDHLGYLYCARCVRRLGITGDPIHRDSPPCANEDCDICYRSLSDIHIHPRA